MAPHEGRINLLEGFCVYYLSDDGQILDYGQYDTLEIAMDQVNAIAGIRGDEWTECHVELRGEYDTIPWSHERLTSACSRRPSAAADAERWASRTG